VRLPTELDDEIVASEQKHADLFAASGQIASPAPEFDNCVDRRYMVGRHEEVANLIDEYHSLGFDEFILAGYPHLEEAYGFAEGVLPILKQKGVA
jgi:alkanesulfonate monooxygenase SsuD/methylene tetrahydromethanopterin reductase-like flavin-dependent oxidoreductase (luciferase family)